MAQSSQADERWKISADNIAEVAILIVGFRNSADIVECLTALSCAPNKPAFDIFICENGGISFYRDLIQGLTEEKGPCISMDASPALNLSGNRFSEIRRLRFRRRPSNVWIGCATENLGYAGGINAWIRPLLNLHGWKGIWILNPDTVPDAHALAALVERADIGRKGMVGSTILDDEGSNRVRFRGGLHWQRLAARGISIGLNQHLDAPHNLSDIEAAMDSPSGASMYVTRNCIEKIGLMDESYFLFFEDLDWGVRAKSLGLGYASASIVTHKQGTATGSARKLAAMPRLTVYLQQRNGIHFVRRHFPWSLPLRIVISYLYAARFLLSGAALNCFTAMKGITAGLRGEVGKPSWHRDAP